MRSPWPWRTAPGPRPAARSDSPTSIPSPATTAWGCTPWICKAIPRSRAAINGWAAEQTRNRIPELLPEGFVNAASVYVLANTIYLKANWQQIFGKYPTEAEPFTRPDGSTVEVDMMHNAELDGGYLVEDGLAVAELPYVGGQLVMRVLVPDDLTALEQRLDASEWDRIETALTSGVVDLSLPKWDIDTSIDLADPLQELGVDIPGGDYSGIAPGVFLGQAVHGASITVDEQGTEAAAGTALGFEESGPPPPDATIRADRPFLYAIVHQPRGSSSSPATSPTRRSRRHHTQSVPLGG